jgi:hypothetical protein
MKLYLMPRETTWWVWLVTVLLLAAGLAGHPAGIAAAIGLSVAQSAFFLWKHRSFAPYSVQIRVAYTAFLIAYLPPILHWLYWVPMLGTLALLLFGYCLMARLLSLMPWNRREPLTARLLLRTFFTPPVLGRADHGLLLGSASRGVCDMEARAAQRHEAAG